MTNRILGVTLLAVGMLAGTVALTQAQEPATVSPDSQFIIKAAQGGLAEVELGNLAKDHAKNSDVKDFGQKMVDDHSKANDELKALALQKNVTLPNEVDPKAKAVMSKLSGLSGDAFDRAYVKDMVADHKEDIAEFRKEANNGKDPDVKAWASKTLPTLENHLGMIQNVQHKLTMNAR
jgi:putative membrane protein